MVEILLPPLLLQLALQPLWVLACSTIVEYSQQGGFYRVPLPSASQTPNLEDQWLERSNSRHQVSPTSGTTRANPSSGRWNYGREIAENFAESGDFHVTFGFFYMPHIYDMGSTDLLPLRRMACCGFFRPGLNPRTRITEASRLISRPTKALLVEILTYKNDKHKV